MSTINYQVKVTPYEVTEAPQSRFARTSIRDTKDIVLEFNIEQLDEAQRAIFLAAKNLRNQVTLVAFSLNEGGERPNQHFGSGYENATVKSVPAIADNELTLEQAIAYIDAQNIVKAIYQHKANELNAAYNLKRAEQRQAEEERRERENVAAIERELAEKQAARVIEFDADGKATINLYNRLALVSEVEMDSRFKNWIKRVTNVNLEAENGYSFEGDWLNDRTIEVKRENAVYLVAGTSGSRNHNTTYYRVMVQRGATLELTDIRANNNDAGWALKIRKQVKELLESLTERVLISEVPLNTRQLNLRGDGFASHINTQYSGSWYASYRDGMWLYEQVSYSTVGIPQQCHAAGIDIEDAGVTYICFRSGEWFSATLSLPAYASIEQIDAAATTAFNEQEVE